MITKKKCGGCNEAKPVQKFSKDKSTKDGYQSYCKTCSRTYHQSEKGKKIQVEYKRSERGKEAAKRYQQSNKGIQKVKRFWQSEKGKDTQRRINATRRTRKNQSGGSYTAREWYILCEYYDFHCLKCGGQFTFDKLTLDHIKPVSKGGSSNIWNLQPLCGKCNASKGNKEIDYRKTLPDWIDHDSPVWQQDTLF